MRAFSSIPPPTPPPPRARACPRPQVEEADVSGSLEGSLESTTKVSIRSTGLVSGNVIYKKMVRGLLLGFCLRRAAIPVQSLVGLCSRVEV